MSQEGLQGPGSDQCRRRAAELTQHSPCSARHALPSEARDQLLTPPPDGLSKLGEGAAPTQDLGRARGHVGTWRGPTQTRPNKDPGWSLLTCCCASPAVPTWGAPVEQTGHGSGRDKRHTGGWAGGSRGALTEWGGQSLLAEDLLVQLLCLLVLVLFQVGRGLRGGPGQGAGILLRPGNVSDPPARPPAGPPQHPAPLMTVQTHHPREPGRPPLDHSCASVSCLTV